MKILNWIVLLALTLAACQAGAGQPAQSGIRVLAVETFLADVAQNVAGDRLKIDALVPVGLDPHAFQPSPRDVARIAEADVLIVNGAGFEGWLEETAQNSGGRYRLIEASAGLQSRVIQGSEVFEEEHDDESDHSEGETHGPEFLFRADPHFWLDPLMMVRYVENIRDGLSAADPPGKETYARNAAAYIEKLKDLDRWIAAQVERVPAANRKIVTNHESFGYFADRYGFTIIGTIVPGASSGAAPSAQQLGQLVDSIRASGAPAIFLETGSSPQLAEQLRAETGIQVITGLHTHSVTTPDGEAPTYIDMMRKNTEAIVKALE